jgi:hypothetical protein
MFAIALIMLIIDLMWSPVIWHQSIEFICFICGIRSSRTINHSCGFIPFKPAFTGSLSMIAKADYGWTPKFYPVGQKINRLILKESPWKVSGISWRSKQLNFNILLNLAQNIYI